MKVIEYNASAGGKLLKRLEGAAFPPEKVAAVRRIVEEVRKRGDAALRDFTRKFDGVSLKSFAVSAAQIRESRKSLTPDLRAAFRRAEKNITDFYRPTQARSWRRGRGDGLEWGEKVTPVESAGLYVPGGRAPLVSTVLMTAVPTRLAGVPRIVIATPPGRDGTVDPRLLAAADYLGITEIYKVGGAQAIAALAFGTRSIPKVDMIAGPGNIYVTLAKKEVFGRVGIDSLAGPSEVAILADARANPLYIAADLLAQAEHGPGGAALLITASKRLIAAVKTALEKIGSRPAGGEIFLARVRSLGEGIELVNRIGPEHLEIMIGKPEAALAKIRNAGAIFIGELSPVAAGDYISGPSHVLPTGGAARFSSPLSVNDFLKKSSLIRYSRRALKKDLPALESLAELEGLEHHLLSARVRLNTKNLK
ncbi:MAG: histidinol dehydrogenase [Candidatus Erginobacter occultus]|nr:histidinol dehydrogenase [Candidatus Erginobacter occultus]